MTTQGMLVLFVVSGLPCAGFSAFVASEKNRDVAAWALFGFFFQLIALLAVIGVPVLPKAVARLGTCRFCGGTVPGEEDACPSCGKML